MLTALMLSAAIVQAGPALTIENFAGEVEIRAGAALSASVERADGEAPTHTGNGRGPEH